MNMPTKRGRLTRGEYGLILMTFLICSAGALLLPINSCPDEAGRKLLCDWITLHKALPTGDEPDTIIRGWGFSYALRPYLSSIIGAVFMRLARIVTASPRLLQAASRLGSVLSLTGCCYFCLRLGHRIFEKRGSAVLFAAFVCYLPQSMFLGMYLNNDVLSLFAASAMLCFMAEAYDSGWSVGPCVGLALSFSVGLLAYYFIYGWILAGILFCLTAVALDRALPGKGRLVLKRAALMAGICLALAGWFFIRNALVHQGDFLGLATEQTSRARMRETGAQLFDFINYRNEGMTLLQFLKYKDYEWFRMTARSFVGVFDYMLIYLPVFRYGIYYSWFLGGILLFIAVARRGRPNRRDGLLLAAMLLASMINIAFHLWQCYARDYQPQGRYVLSVVLPLGFMLAYGLDRISVSTFRDEDGPAKALNPSAALIALWLMMFARSCLETMTQMLPG